MGDKGWKKFVAGETSSSMSKVSEAGHAARDDMASVGWIPERNEDKAGDSPEGQEIAAWLEDKKKNF